MNWVSASELDFEGRLLGLNDTFRAVVRSTGERVTVSCQSENIQHPRDRVEFAANLGGLRRLDHPGLLQIVGYGRFEGDHDGVPSGTAYVLYDPIDIGNLRNLPGVRTWPRARATVLSLLDALVYLHGAGLVHGGLDPSKVFFRSTSMGVQTCITRREDLGRRDPLFVAPERLAYPSHVKTASEDLFSVGRICEEMLAVRTNDELGTYLSDRDLPVQLARWIGRMVAVNPQDRFGSALAALQEFRRLVETRVSQSVRVSTPATDAIERPVEPIASIARQVEDVRRNGVTRVVGVSGATHPIIEVLKRHLRQRYLAEVHHIEDHRSGSRFGLRPALFETATQAMHGDTFAHRAACQTILEAGAARLQVILGWNIEENLYLTKWLEVLRGSAARCLVVLVRTQTACPGNIRFATDVEVEFGHSMDVEMDERLSEIERDTPSGYRALELAAILGPHVADIKWEMACSSAGIEFDLPVVERVVRTGLLTRVSQGWMLEGFELEAVYQRVLAADRIRQLHQVGLQVLGAFRGLDSVTRAFRAAHHALAAGDVARGLEWVEEAAELLLEQRRELEATQLLQFALNARRDSGIEDVVLQVRMWTLLGRAMHRRDAEAAVWWLRRATEVATQLESHGLWMAAVPYLMAANRVKGTPESESIRKEIAIRVVRGEAASLRAQTALQLAREMIEVSKLRVANRVLDMYEPRLLAGPHHAELTYLRGHSALYGGELEKAAKLADIAQDEATALEDPLTYAESIVLAARAAFRLGDTERAAQLYARAAPLLEEVGMGPVL